jgi:hypothetical protein
MAVCDGDRALWEKVKWLMQTVGLPTLCVLDVYHVLKRLWSAAYCFHPEGSDEARAFVAERLRRMLEDEAGYVIGGLKQMGTQHKLRKSKRDQLSKVITLLENNRSYMRYDVCLSQGYPISNGGWRARADTLSRTGWKGWGCDAAPAGDPSEWRLGRLSALPRQDRHTGVVSLSPVRASSIQKNGIAGDMLRPNQFLWYTLIPSHS